MATCYPQAKRLGAQELETDWEAIDSVRRAPEFDLTGDPGMEFLVMNRGWYTSCRQCDQGGLTAESNPFWVRDNAFCNESCWQAFRIEWPGAIEDEHAGQSLGHERQS